MTALTIQAVHAQSVHSVPGPQAQAVAIQGTIKIDGKLDEPIWQTAPVASGFRQAQPNIGAPATQRTEVRFVYDGEFLYVGARMYDDSGAKGVRTRLVRRDAAVNSDYIQVIFDTYHDHIGRLFFLVNPSGVKNDENGLGGGDDPAWDPVWDVKTNIDSLGWTAEMRIPFSQLRYPNQATEQTWGLQMWRQENRLNELSMWSWWGPTESGGPPRFGHLSGLVITSAPGRGEVAPYAVARSSNTPVNNPSDPFERPHLTDGRFGADARILLTSNLTLNTTVNPDFGQVEVDPEVVNLTAFETFFEEKRPFFVEGAGYFGLGGLSCFFCSNTSSLSTFYSRRIGRAPSMAGNAYRAGPYADVPGNTTILGAAKLTGRTKAGWSIGALDAVTGRASATVQLADSTRTHVTVEPPANYFVGRLAKDFRNGATQVRAVATSVVRGLGSDQFLRDRLNTHSELVGLGTDMFFHSRDYHLMAQLAGSSVSGDTADIRRLQWSSARYYNRPDRKPGSNGLLTNQYDPTLTSLRGLGAYARFARQTGNLNWELSANIRTPGFENNDIAALSRVDYYWMSGNVQRVWTKPTSWYRQMILIGGGQQQYNFDGDLTNRQLHSFVYYQMLNYWSLQAFYIRRPTSLDDRATRGGPVVGNPGLNFWSLGLNSDSRKSIVLNLNGDYGCDSDHYCNDDASVTAEWHPRSNVSISLGPSYSHAASGNQYVQAVPDASAAAFFGTRYVFGELRQDQISLNTRINVTFTTNLTFELFVQPLIASGRYARYSEYAAPRSQHRLVYGEDIGTATRSSGGGSAPDTIAVDPDGAGPAASFNIIDPAFTVRSLRGNAVLRWEYHPGSTIYVVWTRTAESDLTRGSIQFNQDATALLRAPSTNIFLVKVSYRIGL